MHFSSPAINSSSNTEEKPPADRMTDTFLKHKKLQSDARRTTTSERAVTQEMYFWTAAKKNEQTTERRNKWTSSIQSRRVLFAAIINYYPPLCSLRTAVTQTVACERTSRKSCWRGTNPFRPTRCHQVGVSLIRWPRFRSSTTLIRLAIVGVGNVHPHVLISDLPSSKHANFWRKVSLRTPPSLSSQILYLPPPPGSYEFTKSSFQ